MRRQLFPKAGEQLQISQGSYGSCSVLVIFQILFNSGSKGRELLNSIFTYTPEGDLVVKLVHNQHSQNLRPADFSWKYGYKSDGKFDKFTVYQGTLDEIATSGLGARTNAFALAVFERIMSHYFASGWDRRERRGSLGAYNAHKTEWHPGKSSVEFLGEVLGLKVQTNISLDLVIRLKILSPSLPIYVAMASPTPDDLDSSHALILDEVYPKNGCPGEYNIRFINPWDNQKRDVYSSNDAVVRESIYNVVVVDREAQEQRMYIVNNPPLLNLICEARRSFSTRLTPALTKHLGELYAEMPYLPELIKTISDTDKRRLYTHIAVNSESKENFISYVLSKYSHASLAEIIIQHEPKCLRDANEKLAHIALKEKNSRIYHYLVRNNFDFLSFTLLLGDSHGQYVQALLHLEGQICPLSDIHKLRRLQSYTDKLFVKDLPELVHGKVHSPFTAQEIKAQFISLCAREALRIIYDHADIISKFSFSFKHCRTIEEVESHYKALLSKVESMRLHPHLLEATQSLITVSQNNDDPSIVVATTKIKADIQNAKLEQEKGMCGTSKRSTHNLRPRLFFQPISSTGPVTTDLRPRLFFQPTSSTEPVTTESKCTSYTSTTTITRSYTYTTIRHG